MGGMRALEVLLGGLPESFDLPVVVVQHRGAERNSRLRAILQRRSALPVREPNDKEPIEGGRVYLAPPDYHLLVEREGFALSTEGRVCHARPSIDVLFESAADAFGSGALAVVLTGANEDGAAGARRIKAEGGKVLVQDPATAETGVMPRAALAATTVDAVLPLEEIAGWLAQARGEGDR
jgi:two-component system, chemotaxis family, protein-glutamate methylesterase/glutaminase